MSRRVVVLHRWVDPDHARYDRYLDHGEHRVGYVTTAAAAAAVPPGAAHVEVADSMDDVRQVTRAVRSVEAACGPAERVVALHEADLELAAALRDRLSLPGWRRSDAVPFRDKLPMLERVAAAGWRTPPFAPANTRDGVARFAAQVGYPVILKPRCGMGSRGVRLVAGAPDLAAVPDTLPEPYLAQAFVGDPIFHVDGVWDGAQLAAWRAGAYVGTGREFDLGGALGSVDVDDPAVLAATERFASGVLSTMSAAPTVFHLEFFLQTGADPAQFTFLEVAARLGGAEVPFVWREVHGLDLLAAHVDLQVGRPLDARYRRPPEAGLAAGWCIMPPPVRPPYQVVRVRPATPLPAQVYHCETDRPGDVIPATPGYERHAAGRFRLRGRTSQDVRQAILAVAARFGVDCIPATGAVA